MSDTPRTDLELSNWDESPEVKALVGLSRQLERELNAANEYARKLSPKVEDQGRDIERLQATLQRKQDAGDLLFEELDDKTPPRNCGCHLFPPCSDCTNHSSSRRAIKAWKEANK